MKAIQCDACGKFEAEDFSKVNVYKSQTGSRINTYDFCGECIVKLNKVISFTEWKPKLPVLREVK